MIRKKSLSILVLMGVLCFEAPPLLGAADNRTVPGSYFQKLAINRTLLARYQKEYSDLKQEAATNGSVALHRRIEGAQYKIKAVKDDLQRLESLLAPKERAGQFMKDLLCVEDAQTPMTTMPHIVADTTLAKADPSRQGSPAKKTREKVFKKNPLPASKHAGKIAELHERALSLVSQSNFKEAETLYQEILLLNPDDDQACIILGHIYLLSGEYEKAENAFHNAIHIDQQNINDITPFYESLIIRNPSDDMAYTNLGYAYLMIDRISEAKQAFRDALQINPNNFPAKNGLGVLGMPN